MEDPGGFLDNSAGFDAQPSGGHKQSKKNKQCKQMVGNLILNWRHQCPQSIPSHPKRTCVMRIVCIRFWNIWGRRRRCHCEQLEDKTSGGHIFPLALPYTGNYR